MAIDYYSGAGIKTPTGKASGGPMLKTPKIGSPLGGGSSNTGVNGGASAKGIPSLSSLFSSLGMGGGSGAPGGSGGPGGGGGGGSMPGGNSMPPMPTGGVSGGNLSISAPENPNLRNIGQEYSGLQNKWGAYGNQLQKYGGELAANSDLAATQAMQRQRDALSGAAKEYGAEASARGIRGSGAAEQDLLNKVINPGQRGLAELNAGLANQGRQQQLGVLQQYGSALGGEGGALGGKLGAANSAANWQQQQQNFGLEQWKAQQNNALAQWQLQNQQQNQGWNQLMSLIGAFSGF